MAMQFDVWAITPANDDALLRAAASFTTGAATLLTNQVAPNGCGYKIIFTSTGNETGKTFTIVGTKVGDQTGALTTETVAGGSGTSTSTNYYSSVVSISISATSVGNVKIGTTGSLALPRCRLKGLYYVGTATAGTVKVNLNGSSGSLLLQINTPASATVANSLFMPADGILTGRSGNNDYAVVTLTDVTYATLICG
jgi:hypothetical protein